MASALDLAPVLSRLKKVTRLPNGNYKCCCPFHDDDDPSMTLFAEGNCKCHSGCGNHSAAELRAQLGLEEHQPDPDPVHYDYKNAEGAVVCQTVRYYKDGRKRFYQRHHDGADWVNNLKGVDLVLYRLPELLSADVGTRVYIVEGEKDVDRLVSMGLVATTNPMGAGKWRAKYARWLQGRRVVVIPDNDPPDPKRHGLRPGLDHAHEVADSLRPHLDELKLLFLADLPEKGDVSDWLDAGGTAAQMEALADAALEYVPGVYARPPVDGNGHHPDRDLRDTEVLVEKSRWRTQSLGVIKDMWTKGRFINAGDEHYFFVDATKQLVPLGKKPGDSFDLEFLLSRLLGYGIGSSHPGYKDLFNELRYETRANGDLVEVQNFSYYDQEENVLYFDLVDGRLLRLDGKTVERVDNGHDGVLFVHSAEQAPWEYLPDQRRSVSKALLDGLSFAGATREEPDGLTASELGYLFMMWLLCIPFRSVLPVKPIQVATGPAGSGKSTLNRRAGKLLIGPDFEVEALSSDDEGKRNFFVAVTNFGFIAYDNVDGRNPWLEDALATLSTGVGQTKKELYTTNTPARFRGKAFIALTARTPRFKRPDIAQRVLPFPLQPLEKMVPEHLLLREFRDHRDELLTDYVEILNQVVAVKPETAMEPTASNLRLADFAHLATRVGQGMGLPDEFVAGILTKVIKAQKQWAAEEDDLRLFLDLWLEQQAPGALDLGYRNQGRPVRTAELFKELKELADAAGYRWRFSTPISLGMHLKHMQPSLEEYFVIENKGHGEQGKTYAFSTHEWWREQHATG